MRNIIFVLILMVGFLACSKKNSVDNNIPEDIPTWLQVRIAEIKKADYKELYLVAEYKIDGMIFYNIVAPHMSCMLCELYDTKGVKANIAFAEQTSVEKIRTIWPVNSR